MFARYCVHIGALDQGEAKALLGRCLDALRAAGEEQADHQETEEPTTRLINLLVGALRTGRAHISDTHGREPKIDADPVAWGYLAGAITPRGKQMYIERGQRIGWLDGPDDVYLDSTVAWAVALQMGRELNQPLLLNKTTMWRRLHQMGLLQSVEEGRGRPTVRRRIDGTERTVLHLPASAFTAAIE